MISPILSQDSPKKYRKRSVTIEAMSFTGDNLSALADWVLAIPPANGAAPQRVERPWSKKSDYRCPQCGDSWGRHAQITTLEGDEHFLCPGDQVIRGVKGEFYGCKPDIFAATYDPAAHGSPD